MARYDVIELNSEQRARALKSYRDQTGKRLPPHRYERLALISLNEVAEPREYARVIAALLNSQSQQARYAAVRAALEFVRDHRDSDRYHMGLNAETVGVLQHYALEEFIGFDIEWSEDGSHHCYDAKARAEMKERYPDRDFDSCRNSWRHYQGHRRRVELISAVIDKYGATGVIMRKGEPILGLGWLARNDIADALRFAVEETLCWLGGLAKPTINHLLDHSDALDPIRFEATMAILKWAHETSHSYGRTIINQTRNRRQAIWRAYQGKVAEDHCQAEMIALADEALLRRNALVTEISNRKGARISELESEVVALHAKIAAMSSDRVVDLPSHQRAMSRAMDRFRSNQQCRLDAAAD